MKREGGGEVIVLINNTILISLQRVEKAALVGEYLSATTGPTNPCFQLVPRVTMTRVTPAVTLVPCRIWHALVRAG